MAALTCTRWRGALADQRAPHPPHRICDVDARKYPIEKRDALYSGRLVCASAVLALVTSARSRSGNRTAMDKHPAMAVAREAPGFVDAHYLCLLVGLNTIEDTQEALARLDGDGPQSLKARRRRFRRVLREDLGMGERLYDHDMVRDVCPLMAMAIYADANVAMHWIVRRCSNVKVLERFAAMAVERDSAAVMPVLADALGVRPCAVMDAAENAKRRALINGWWYRVGRHGAWRVGTLLWSWMQTETRLLVPHLDRVDNRALHMWINGMNPWKVAFYDSGWIDAAFDSDRAEAIDFCRAHEITYSFVRALVDVLAKGRTRVADRLVLYASEQDRRAANAKLHHSFFRASASKTIHARGVAWLVGQAWFEPVSPTLAVCRMARVACDPSSVTDVGAAVCLLDRWPRETLQVIGQRDRINHLLMQCAIDDRLDDAFALVRRLEMCRTEGVDEAVAMGPFDLWHNASFHLTLEALAQHCRYSTSAPPKTKESIGISWGCIALKDTSAVLDTDAPRKGHVGSDLDGSCDHDGDGIAGEPFDRARQRMIQQPKTSENHLMWLRWLHRLARHAVGLRTWSRTAPLVHAKWHYVGPIESVCCVKPLSRFAVYRTDAEGARIYEDLVRWDLVVDAPRP